MADPFVAEVRVFPFSFPPRGWAFCDGQIMPISQNTALFSLLGTIYGGNGKSTFALPDLQGRAPMQCGHAPGLSDYPLGDTGGWESVTLSLEEIPQHSHAPFVSGRDGDSQNPRGALLAAGSTIFSAATQLTDMAPASVAIAGGSLPHNNMQPYLTVSFCIALQGIFPARP